MKKFLTAVFLLFSFTLFAGEKGDFAITAGYKQIEFDVINDLSADLGGASVSYHAKLMDINSIGINLNTDLGYYVGKVDDNVGSDESINDVSFKVGLGLSKDIGNFTIGVDANGSFDYITINSTDFSPFGISAVAYLGYTFGNNHKIGAKYDYTKFLTEDALDYSTTVSLTYGFNF